MGKKAAGLLIITIILIAVIVWQVAYHLPRIEKANKNVSLSEEAVKLTQIWKDCAQARVNAIESGTSAPDCTAEKDNALRAVAIAKAQQ